MIEIKDSGRGFYWSRPRIVGLLFGACASPIIFVFAGFGHKILGVVLFVAVCMGLTVAYLLPTRLRKFVQDLIPTSAEKVERSRMDPG